MISEISGDKKRRVLVAGWQPPPFNGRVHEVVALMRSPFTDEFDFIPYDTRMRNRRGGSRPDVTLTRNAVAQVTGVRSVLKAEQPDFTVFFVGPGAAFWRDLFIFRELRQSGPPVVLRLIGGVLTEKIANLPAPVRRVVLSEFRHARVIMTETHAMVEDLRRLLPDVPAVRVPNFVHLEEFPPLAQRRQDGPGKVIYFGNMTPSKGVETVLASIDAVCDSHPGTRFHFIGGELKPGYLSDFRARAASLRNAAAVQVHGRLSREVTHQIVADADLFAFPTQWPGEGQPAALIEAMAMGVVPIASRWRGAGEVVRDQQNGLLVPHDDPGNLTAAINRLLGDAVLRHTLSRAARETVLREYAAPPAFDQFLRIVQGDLKKGSPIHVS